MANKVDPDLIQRFLAVNSVKIRNDMQKKQFIRDNMYYGQILTLDALPSGVIPRPSILLLDQAESSKMRHVEHQLLSLNPIPSTGSAMELFADLETSESVNFSYSIHNNILIDVYDDLFIINIDEVNNSEAAKNKFFISKATLTNRAKDTFTARSNYLLTLNIAFTYFDDLLEQNVIARSFNDPEKVIKLPLIKILYKSFDTRTDYDNQQKSIRDGTGLYFNQVLKIDNKRFPTLVDDLDSEIHRTLHMTYYNHEFNVFQNQDPLIYSYENELTIDYVTYEADTSDQLITSKYTHAAVSNLYDLLNDGNIVTQLKDIYSDSNLISFNEAIKAIEAEKTKLENAQLKIKCLDIYEDLKDEDPYKATLETSVSDFKNDKETLKKEVDRISSLMTAYKSNLNRTLIYYILNECTQYKITVNIEEDLDYQKKTETLFEAMGGWAGVGSIALVAAGGIALAAGTLATGGALLAAAPILTAGGQALLFGGMAPAGVAIGGAFNYDPVTYTQPKIFNLAKATKKTIDVKPGDTDTKIKLRVQNEQKKIKAIEDRIKNIRDDQLFGNLEGTVGGSLIGALGNVEGKEVKENLRKKITAINDTIEAINAGIISSEDSPDEIEVPFILYGDLIKLIKKPNNQNLLVVCGGKLIPEVDDASLNTYMNLAHMPISSHRLWNFLQDRIAKAENRKGRYNSEDFLRDTHDILLKGAMRNADSVLDGHYAKYLPGNMYMHASVHTTGASFNSLLRTGTLNMFDESAVAEFKTNFIKSKNIQKRIQNDPNLAKVYTIGTSEDMRYFDYYDGFKDWADKQNPKKSKTSYASIHFQEYMIKEHLTPCVLIRYTANGESMLKKKNVSFTRIDNQNLKTGNFLDGQPVFRLPYNFSSAFKPYIAFFLDIGSLLFISPPQTRNEININTFGFGGLYLIKESKLEYNFQKLEAGGPTLPNEESIVTLGGTMLTHGDSIRVRSHASRSESEAIDCIDKLNALSSAPAAP